METGWSAPVKGLMSLLGTKGSGKPGSYMSSIYVYKNDVGVMYSHSQKMFLFFLFHNLHEHILVCGVVF